MIAQMLCAPEWEPHECCWLAWPKLEDEWPNGLEAVRAEVAQLILEIAKSEQVRLLVDEGASLPSEVAQIVERVHLPYGDIWTRDSVPIRLRDGTVVEHRFNGWGDKYLFPGDDVLAQNIASAAPVSSKIDLVLEGGGLEFDGEGPLLITRSSLLNDNRNPGVSEAEATDRLKKAYGVTDVHWLEGILQNDHTDGHIDTLARFIGPSEVLCHEPNRERPNFEALSSIYDGLMNLLDSGAVTRVRTIPAPEAIFDSDGTALPASYMNFYIANHAIIMPAYGLATDEEARAALTRLNVYLDDRPVVLSPAREILHGGGALHCITRDWPRQAT